MRIKNFDLILNINFFLTINLMKHSHLSVKDCTYSYLPHLCNIVKSSDVMFMFKRKTYEPKKETNIEENEKSSRRERR